MRPGLGMAPLFKRSAAMLLRFMPAPDEAGLGHVTRSWNTYQHPVMSSCFMDCRFEVKWL